MELGWWPPGDGGLLQKAAPGPAEVGPCDLVFIVLLYSSYWFLSIRLLRFWNVHTGSGVLGSVCTSPWELLSYLSSSAFSQSCHIGSLKSARVSIYFTESGTCQESGLCLPPGESVVKHLLAHKCHGSLLLCSGKELPLWFWWAQWSLQLIKNKSCNNNKKASNPIKNYCWVDNKSSSTGGTMPFSKNNLLL